MSADPLVAAYAAYIRQHCLSRGEAECAVCAYAVAVKTPNPCGGETFFGWRCAFGSAPRWWDMGRIGATAETPEDRLKRGVETR
jgi:hypothetical protein